MTIVCVVGGHGEVEAVPILVRRVASALDPPRYPRVERPIRVPESRLLQASELERTVSLAASRAGDGGGVLILLDCDDGCPAELGPELLRRAQAARPDVPIALVLAKREFEAWFLAAAESLRGRRGLSGTLASPAEPESIRGAKEWLSRNMTSGRAYRETLDQPALTSVLDIDAAGSAASFDKCRREVERLALAVSSEESL